MNSTKSIDLIRLVNLKLSKLNEKIVYVGGATLPFFANNAFLEKIRPTEDVDCLVHVVGHFRQMEKKLEAIGIHLDTTSHVRCRFRVNGLTVDVMTTNPDGGGSSSKWYESGFSNSVERQLATGEKINTLDYMHFLATKINAFGDRGEADPLFSKDLEDIALILADDATFTEEVNECTNTELKTYVTEGIYRIKKDPFLLDALKAQSPRVFVKKVKDATVTLKGGHKCDCPCRGKKHGKNKVR